MTESTPQTRKLSHTVLARTDDKTEVLVHTLSDKKLVLNTFVNPKGIRILEPAQRKSEAIVKMPASVNLTSLFPPVFDQGALGSCVANATSALLASANFRATKRFYIPSRLYLYFMGRALDAVQDSEPYQIITDVGLYTDSALRAVNSYGTPSETQYPYNEERFDYMPPGSTMNFAWANRKVNYIGLQKNVTALKQSLAANQPFMFGITVYENFFDESVSQTGTIPLPSGSDVGGHAMVAVGYDDSKSAFLIRNSWGTAWGNKGYGTIPYEYIVGENGYDPLTVTSFVGK